MSKDNEKDLGNTGEENSQGDLSNDFLTIFEHELQDLQGRSERIRSLLNRKRRDREKEKDQEKLDRQQRREQLQAQLEADERYQQIRETIYHPDMELLLLEVQNWVENYISQQTNKEEKLKKRSWQIIRRMSQIHEGHIGDFSMHFHGWINLIMKVEGYTNNAWRFGLSISWDKKNNQPYFNVFGQGNYAKRANSFEQVVDVISRIMTEQTPFFWRTDY